MDIRYYVVVNPLSGGGLAKKLWPTIKTELAAQGFVFDFEITQHPQHTITLVKQAVEKGYRHILAVGGDGTLHEAANGILEQTVVPSVDVKLGLISVGTGNDWGKTLQVPADYKKCIDIIKQGTTYLQDVGKVYFDDKGIRKHRYFVNIAGFAYDAYVTQQTNIAKESGKLGPFYYFLGVFKCLFSYKTTHIKISSEGGVLIEKPIFNGTIGICKYNGGGMIPNPDAVPNDGIFNITTIAHMPPLKVMLKVGRLYDGKIAKLTEAALFTGKRIRLESSPTVMVETDGEVLGTSPFDFEILPKSLNVYSPLKA